MGKGLNLYGVSKMICCKLLIVGSGAAGITAAVSAWESGCQSIFLADRAAQPGGVLLQCFHEGFGIGIFGKELTGPGFAELLAESLKKTGVQYYPETEVFSLSREKIAVISRRGLLEQISFEKVILATGSREKTIGALPITGTRPAGIFTAGQAQERINLRRQEIGENILILGSGDLGMIIARRFALEKKNVIAVLEQESHYGGIARNYHRCIEPYHIPIQFRTTVTEVHGIGRICGVTIRKLDTGEKEFISCDTLVTAVGLIPDRTLLNGPDIPDWLYLAGNCRQIHDIADSAAAEARQIAREAVTP